ncbi:hypothetical protein C2R22_17360 [Salinigranum rubrum]|uniref:DUF5518 domain-containing protein n=1 Tax=Salinigranum rubrum TaxID=755307 RepID=A0A2I8VMT7_9EURY|nr:DUF5518 domain-containing protein [Salinigranum rubrum]AUV83194.1 hypothetical protein C2R22_17360 [Salinigranum rubrum]
MTNWRAVGVGFVLLVVIGTAGVSVPGVGQLGAGLVGGFAAGYLAGGGPGSGAWHGLVAGSLAGLVVAVVVAFFGSLLGGIAGGPLGALVGGFGPFVVLAAITLLLAADSAVAGALGGWVKRQTT